MKASENSKERCGEGFEFFPCKYFLIILWMNLIGEKRRERDGLACDLIDSPNVLSLSDLPH